MKKKILTLQFRHETNRFCPKQADLTAFQNSRFLVGEEVIPNQRGVDTDLCACLDVFLPRQDMEVIPVLALYATPSGPVTEDVYDFVTKKVEEAILAYSPLDGVFLDLHGAMVADGHDDGEGDLLEKIRQMVGPEVPVMVPLDLHANITEKMARCADVLLPYNTYPHVDIYNTGHTVAKLLEKTLDGQLKTAMGYCRVPFLQPLIPSQSPQLEPLYQLAKEMESRPGVLNVRFSHGFFPADIENMGMAAIAITDGDQALADSLAKELADAIIERIPYLKQEYISLDEALDLAMGPGKKPVALGDASDNPGAGGLGDTTHLLRRILERGITGAAVATILDPASVEKCEQAGVGSTVELELGGWSDPYYSGGPLKVTAQVLQITDGKYVCAGPVCRGVTACHGKTAVIEVAGNKVIVTSIGKQPHDLEIYRRHGIAPEEQRILVVKSTIHYRASFGSVAGEMITLSLPGFAVPVPEGYVYKNWKGPVGQ